MTTNTLIKHKYRLEGLGCANCGAKIEARAAKLPGIQSATLNFPEKLLVLTTNDDTSQSSDQIAILQQLCDSVEHGIHVTSTSTKMASNTHTPKSEQENSHISRWELLAALLLFVIGLLPLLPDSVKTVFFLFSALLSAHPVMRGALAEIKGRSMGENLLLIIALVAAFIIGESAEGAMVALLFTFGELLENMAVGRSRRQIEKLAEIRPDRAFLYREDGTTVEIDADAVEIGNTLLIPAHERVAVDCMVTEGTSEVDASALTGESRPVYVSAGSHLLSGTMNGNGTLTVRATNRADSSAAARILDMVSESAARKGSSERFITRFARIYTPIATLLAVLLAIMAPLLGLGEWHTWIYRALVFLVASCPCALVISVPLGFYSGIGAASRQGVLIKGGRYIEALARAKAAAFDKTGTLTTGQLTITRIDCAPGYSKADALRLAALAEMHSPHPAAQAILKEAGDRGNAAVLSAMTEYPGLGVSATIDGAAVLCGGIRLMDAQHIALPWNDAAVYLAVNNKAVAAFQMDSELHPHAKAALERLHKQGFTRIAMVTGDRKAEADRIAAQIHIDEVYADLLPEGKLDTLRKLKHESGKTLFVGDGINDAPVLAEADAGIAMGFGSAAAIEAGDVVLTSGSLSKLPDAIRIARRVMGVVRFNIAFALAVKAAVLILAALGYAPMWAAVFADVGVSLICVLNSARLFL